MRPFIFLLPFLVALAKGKPGGSYNYPTPTPSAAPALLSNLGTPSPSISPSVFNLPAPAPSIAPSLLVENVIGAGQYGPPPLSLSNEGTQSLGAQSFGLQYLGAQSLGLQSLGPQYLGYQSLGSQSVGLGYPFAGQGFGFDQSGFNFGGELSSFGYPQLPLGSPQLPLGSSQLPLGSPQLPLGSPQLPLGSSQLPLGSPQLPLGSPQLPIGSYTPTATPAPNLGVTAGPVNISPVAPTITIPNLDIRGPSVQNAGGAIVQKHVYVHVAPEEPEERLPPRRIVFPPPRKHYRIIFVKAPTPPAPTPPVTPPRVQDEERTLIYVLVKKPDQQPQIDIRTAAPTAPSKPEVYFIKYDTRKESVAGGSYASGPVALEGRIKDISEAENEEPVKIGGSRHNTDVELDLNKASLSGGSALSLAVTGSPLDNALEDSSTPVSSYGPPENK